MRALDPGDPAVRGHGRPGDQPAAAVERVRAAADAAARARCARVLAGGGPSIGRSRGSGGRRGSSSADPAGRRRPRSSGRPGRDLRSARGGAARRRRRRHAVRLAEGVRYGLVTSVHGRDLGEVLGRGRAGWQTGLVKVNAPTTGVDFWAPFGGERESSYGPREQGLAALDFYASTRTITLARTRERAARAVPDGGLPHCRRALPDRHGRRPTAPRGHRGRTAADRPDPGGRRHGRPRPRLLCSEPRGHADMYGCFVVAARPGPGQTLGPEAHRWGPPRSASCSGTRTASPPPAGTARSRSPRGPWRRARRGGAGRRSRVRYRRPERPGRRDGAGRRAGSPTSSSRNVPAWVSVTPTGIEVPTSRRSGASPGQLRGSLLRQRARRRTSASRCGRGTCCRWILPLSREIAAFFGARPDGAGRRHAPDRRAARPACTGRSGSRT